MRRAALAALLALGALAAPARAEEEPPPETRAFVEVDAGKTTFFVGEAIPITLRLGYDASWFAAHAGPVSGVRLGVPVSVEWPSAPEGTTPLLAHVPSGPTRSLAVNDEVAEGLVRTPRRVDGRAYEVLEVVRFVVASEPRALHLGAPTLRFVHASRIVEDALGGPVPLETAPVVVRGKGVDLVVEAVPAAGRPPDFSGAVGRFRVRAQVVNADVVVDEPFGLMVTVESGGVPAAVERAPELRLEGFRAYDASSQVTTAGDRLFSYRAGATRADLTAVPSIPFTYYEPPPDAGYRTAWTEAIPLRVRDDPALRTPAAPPDEPAAPPDPMRVLGLALSAGALVAGAVLLARNRSRRVASARPSAQAVRPAEAFRRRVARGEDVADAFAQALAAIVPCPPAAVVGPDLAARLVRAGTDPDAAARAAAAMEALVARRYGGGGEAPDAETAASILEACATAGGAPAARDR